MFGIDSNVFCHVIFFILKLDGKLKIKIIFNIIPEFILRNALVSRTIVFIEIDF